MKKENYEYTVSDINLWMQKNLETVYPEPSGLILTLYYNRSLVPTLRDKTEQREVQMPGHG